MNFALIVVFVLVFILQSCGSGSLGTSRCATELSYVTNRFTSGEQALKEASVYYANFNMGSPEVVVDAIVDTASANLVINQRRYDYGDETITGHKPMHFDNGKNRSVAVNAKDVVNVGCIDDFAAGFSLTLKERPTQNYLGLAFRDPAHHPHEKKSAPFFDQLVKEYGINDAFSLALCGTRGNSKLVLGGIDERMSKLLGNFIPIIEKSSYVVPAVTLRRVDNKKILGNFPGYDAQQKTGTRTIIDSSSPFMMFDATMAESVSREIEKEAQNLGLLDHFPEGFFRTERFNSTKVVRFLDRKQMLQFPSLEITFIGSDGHTKALELSPLHYFKEIDNEDPLARVFAVRESNNDVILGQPFLENHFTYFDRKNARIAFGNIDFACAK